MLEATTRVEPNAADIAAKVIDGEAIIMNLSNGLYYSMDGVGAWVWTQLEDGRSLDEIAETVERRYGVERDTALRDVTGLVDRLLTEELVRVAEGTGNGARAPEVATATREAYVTPELNRYDDMADLLALDPPMPGLTDPAPEE